MSKKMLALMLSSVAVLAACDQKEVQKAVDEAMDKDLPAVEQQEGIMDDDKKMDADEKDAMKKDDSMGEDDKKMDEEKMEDHEMMDDDKKMEDHEMDNDKNMEDDAMVKGDAEVKVDAEVMMDDDDEEEQPSAMEKSSGQYVAYKDGVIGNGQKSVLFFHATWCPACKQNNEYLTQWYGSEEFPVSVYKVDYDTATELKKQYGITGQDTFVQIDGSGKAIAQARFPSQSALRGLLQ